MSLESGAGFENRKFTAEAILDRLSDEDVPGEILKMLVDEGNIIGSRFMEDLAYCFREMGKDQKIELASEILAAIEEMKVICANSKTISHLTDYNSVTLRANLKEPAKRIAVLVDGMAAKV